MASEYWWDNDGYGNQAIRAVISLWKTDDGATSAKIHAAGGAQTYNSTGWGGSWINFAGHEESGGCYGYSDNYYWANSSWWWTDLNLGTVTKTHSEQTITKKCYFVYGRWPGITLEATASITVGAKTKYTVSYNANGGTGAPSNQDKWHGESLTLQSGTPTKLGFSFKGWTGSDGNTYQAGGTYTGNAALTLTAIWEALSPDFEEVSDTEIGQDAVVKFIPQSTSLTYKVKFSLGTWEDTSETITPLSTDEYTYNHTIPMAVCSQLPNDTEGLMQCDLMSYSGGSLLDTQTKYFTVSVPESVVPSKGSENFTDGSGNALNTFLQNRSWLRAWATFGGVYGSTIISVVLEVDGKTFDADSVTGIADSDIFTEAGTYEAQLYATDSRGRSSGFTYTFTVYEYELPSAVVTLTRSGTDTVLLEIEPSYTEVGSNSGTYQIDSGTPFPFDNGMFIEYEQTSSYLDSRNITFWVKIADAVTFILYEVKLYPGKGNRFSTLDEDQFYVGIDDKGWKDLSDYDGGIDDGTIWFERTSGADPVGVGMPMILEPDTDYELLYLVNDTDNTVGIVSFFWVYGAGTPTETSYKYISATENLMPGDIFHTPKLTDEVIDKILWGIVTLGATLPEETPIVRREFTDVKIRKVEEDIERLDWTVETGNLGLDTPLQKYISKVVIRMAFEGQMHVDVAYDNEPFKEVYRKASEKLKSFDIPINVKRCDHFRFRIAGKGIAKIYSIGYNEEAGSEIQ